MIIEFNTIEEACEIAASMHGVEEKAEGTYEERFMAGWVNAMDMMDAGSITTDAEFKKMVFEVIDI